MSPLYHIFELVAVSHIIENGCEVSRPLVAIQFTMNKRSLYEFATPSYRKS